MASLNVDQGTGALMLACETKTIKILKPRGFLLFGSISGV